MFKINVTTDLEEFSTCITYEYLLVRIVSIVATKHKM